MRRRRPHGQTPEVASLGIAKHNPRGAEEEAADPGAVAPSLPVAQKHLDEALC